MTTSERVCPGCGGEPRSVRSLYCSEACYHRTNSRRYRQKQKALGIRRKKTKYPATCIVCRNVFDATVKDAKYCSTGRDSCEAVAKSSRPHLTSKPRWRLIYESKCITCGKRISDGRLRRYCDAECRKGDLHPAAPFDCDVCGQHVVPGQDGHHAQANLYCSPKCRRRAHAIRFRDSGRKREARHRRRARKRGAFVAPVYLEEIWNRDHGRCRLCGHKIDRTKSAPHPHSLTLDHIVPLAAGGTHEPANVQLAHFRCNALKGDRAANDQLRLVG